MPKPLQELVESVAAFKLVSGAVFTKSVLTKKDYSLFQLGVHQIRLQKFSGASRYMAVSRVGPAAGFCSLQS